jgi:hypothetical protein
MVLSTLGLSLVSGKQIHYLVPVMPPGAMLTARILIQIRRAPKTIHQQLNAALFLAIGGALMVVYFIGHQSGDIAPFTDFPKAIILFPFAVGGYYLLRPAESFRALIVQLALTMTLMLTALQFALHGPLHQGYDISRCARLLAQAQHQGHPVAVFPCRFQQQFQFSGRLEHPLEPLSDVGSIEKWTQTHPSGYLLLVYRPEKPIFPRKLAIHDQHFRGRRISLFNNASVVRYMGDRY